MTANHGLGIKLHLSTVIKHIFSCLTSSEYVTFKSCEYHGINFVGTSGISEMSSREMLHKMLYTEAFGNAELVGDLKKTLNILYGFTEKPLDLCCYCTDKFQTDSGKSSLDSAQNKLYLLIFPTLQFANVSVGNLSSNKFRLSTFMSHWSGRSSQRFKCIRRLKPKNLRFTCFKLVILLHN